MAAEIPTTVLTSLRCGECNKYLTRFPIHFLKAKNISICGRCSEKYSMNEHKLIRNTPYEILTSALTFPCINDNKGCLETLYPEEVQSHEEVCLYRPVDCPIKPCAYQGKCNDIYLHFLETHSELLLRGNEFEINFLDSYQIFNFVILDSRKEIFLFKREFNIEQQLLDCYVTCCNITPSATKFYYTIELVNGARESLLSFPARPVRFSPMPDIEISSEAIKNKFNDPPVIIGILKIYKEIEEPSETACETNPEIDYDTLAAMECPVCFDYIKPPIYQCVTGHNICTSCKEKVSECPTCKREIRDTRNFSLEKMAYQFNYPCKFAHHGCRFYAKPPNFGTHEKYCNYGRKSCPVKDYEPCIWEGSSAEISQHLYMIHHDFVLDIDTIRIFITRDYYESEERSCYVLHAFDKVFKLHYLYRENNFYLAVQLLGHPEECMKYKAQLNFIDNTNNRQRLFVRTFCAPMTDKTNCFTANGQFLCFPKDLLSRFITDSLTFKIQILKD